MVWSVTVALTSAHALINATFEGKCVCVAYVDPEFRIFPSGGLGCGLLAPRTLSPVADAGSLRRCGEVKGAPWVSRGLPAC